MFQSGARVRRLSSLSIQRSTSATAHSACVRNAFFCFITLTLLLFVISLQSASLSAANHLFAMCPIAVPLSRIWASRASIQVYSLPRPSSRRPSRAPSSRCLLAGPGILRPLMASALSLAPVFVPVPCPVLAEFSMRFSKSTRFGRQFPLPPTSRFQFFL